VPTAGDTAVFTANTGPYTFKDNDPNGPDNPITYTGPFNDFPLIDVPVSIAAIQVDSSANFALTVAAGASFTLTGASEWDTGSISVASTGTFTNDGTLALAGPAAKTLLSGTLTNAGTMSQTASGPLVLSDQSTLDNQKGGLYDLQADTAGIAGTYGRLTNEGTLQKSLGAPGGTTLIQSRLTDTNGTIHVATGTLVMDVGGQPTSTSF
jgi:hypothetical protein